MEQYEGSDAEASPYPTSDDEEESYGQALPTTLQAQKSRVYTIIDRTSLQKIQARSAPRADGPPAACAAQDF
jgi:hypothetical protein